MDPKRLLMIGGAALAAFFVYRNRASATSSTSTAVPQVLRYKAGELNGLQIDVHVGDTVEIEAPEGWSMATNYGSHTGVVEQAFVDTSTYEGWEWRIKAEQQQGFSAELSALPQTWPVAFHGPSGEKIEFTIKIHA